MSSIYHYMPSLSACEAHTCRHADIVRAGKRYKQHEVLQRWYCHQCAVSFTPRRAGKGSVYPLRVTFEALCQFCQGHTISRTVDYLRRRFGIAIHPRPISRWLSEHRDLTTYACLRDKARRHFTPRQLIRSTRLHHKQVYLHRTYNSTAYRTGFVG